MKLITLLAVDFCMTIALAGASLVEMTSEELSKELRGSWGGKYLTQLVVELNEPGSDALIEKCLRDDVLKKYMYRDIHKFPNDAVRDRLSLELIRDHGYWERAGDSIRPIVASAMSECMWIHLPSLKVKQEDRMALAYTLQSTPGRNALAEIYQKYLNLPLAERNETHPNAVALIGGINGAIAKFGTLEYVLPNLIRIDRGNAAKPATIEPPPEKVVSPDQPAIIVKKLPLQRVESTGSSSVFWIGSGLVCILLTLLLAQKITKIIRG